MITILKDTMVALGFDLDAAIASYQAALLDFAKSPEGTAPPTVNPLVEQIVKENDGKYTVVEPETKLPPADPNSLTTAVNDLTARMDTLTDQLIEVSTRVAAVETATAKGTAS